MAVIRWLVGGLLGGLAGGLIWVLVGYFTGAEIGWIAWGVGFLVGVGVRYAAYLGEQDETPGQGILAGALAIGTILVAKFSLFYLLVSSSGLGELQEALGNIEITDEMMISSKADEIVEEMERRQTLAWPPGMTAEEAFLPEDYPPGIWQQAEAQWRSMSEDERKRQLATRRQQLAAFQGELADAVDDGFKDLFSPWDILWIALATITAYQIGVGTYNTD